MLGVAAMLASCSQEELGSPQGGGVAVIRAIVDDGLQTRVPTYADDDVTIDRCLLEVYDQGGNLVGSQHEAQASGADGAFTFIVSGLDPDAVYDFVFWADNAGAAAYGGDLKNRKLAEGADLTKALAFCGMLDGVTPTNAEKVTLTHAVAKVTLKTTSTLNTGDEVRLDMTDVTDSWNVQGGVASGDADLTYAYTLDKTVTGQADGTEVTTFYVPAPTEGANSNMTLTYTPNGSGTPRDAAINSVPLKANYRTVLRGDIASLFEGETISISAKLEATWNDQDEEITFPETPGIIILAKPGTLTEEAVRAAYEEGNGTITVVGQIIAQDLEAIRDCHDLTANLDLSGATLMDFLDSTQPETEFPLTFRDIMPMDNPMQLTSIILPEGIESLYATCFAGQTQLANVTLPESLTTIENYVFSGTTSLISITIPANVTSIGTSVFPNGGLKSVTLEGTTPPTIVAETFKNVELEHIYVPAEAVETYKTAEGWSNYADIIESVENMPGQ